MMRGEEEKKVFGTQTLRPLLLHYLPLLLLAARRGGGAPEGSGVHSGGWWWVHYLLLLQPFCHNLGRACIHSKYGRYDNTAAPDVRSMLPASTRRRCRWPPWVIRLRLLPALRCSPHCPLLSLQQRAAPASSSLESWPALPGDAARSLWEAHGPAWATLLAAP